MNEMVIQGIALERVEGEPRVAHPVVAEQLGYTRARDLAELIDTHAEKLRAFGFLPLSTVKLEGRGRPAKVVLLNRRQVLYLCAKSEQAAAVDVTMRMVHVFDEALSGPPAPARPVVGLDIATGARVGENPMQRRELIATCTMLAKANRVAVATIHGMLRRAFSVPGVYLLPALVFPEAMRLLREVGLGNLTLPRRKAGKLLALPSAKQLDMWATR